MEPSAPGKIVTYSVLSLSFFIMQYKLSHTDLPFCKNQPIITDEELKNKIVF